MSYSAIPKGDSEAENTKDEVEQQSSGVGQRSDSKNDGSTVAILDQKP